MTIIYQMAKVASRSWQAAAQPEQGLLPLHCHAAVPQNLVRLKDRLYAPGRQQTICNMILPANALRAGEAVWKEIESARRTGTGMRVISGMRDPVARSISILIFMADFYGHVSRPLKPGNTSADDVIDLLHENWKSVLEDKEPDDSFEWLLWYSTRGYRTWFEQELGAALGVDVLSSEFSSADASQRIDTADCGILIYRVEDMAPESSSHAALLNAAGRFLGITLRSFPKFNTGSARRSRDLSAEVRSKFRLPPDMLDAIYNEPFVQHFYSREEIEAFKRRWEMPDLQGTRNGNIEPVSPE